MTSERSFSEPSSVIPWSHLLGVFDLETTGIDIETSRIVSANVSLIDRDGMVVERHDWLADPGVEIPDQASAVHGITTEHAQANGRSATEVIGEIIAEIRAIFNRGLALTVYNAPYDLSILNREAVRHNVTPLADPSPIIDPLVLDRAVDRYRKGKRTLEASAIIYGVELTDAHDAGADAIAAGRVAQQMAAKYPTELEIDVNQLHQNQISWSAEQSASFADYMRRTHNPDFRQSSGWPER